MRELTREEIHQVHGGLVINLDYPASATYGELAMEQTSSATMDSSIFMSDMFQF